jgi:hypothetical protein
MAHTEAGCRRARRRRACCDAGARNLLKNADFRSAVLARSRKNLEFPHFSERPLK